MTDNFSQDDKTFSFDSDGKEKMDSRLRGNDIGRAWLLGSLGAGFRLWAFGFGRGTLRTDLTLKPKVQRPKPSSRSLQPAGRVA